MPVAAISPVREHELPCASRPFPPEWFRRTVRLRDGRLVRVAPLTPADAGELGAAIRSADRDTLRARFCGTPPRVTPGLLRHLTELDYVRRFALVARDGAGRGVAIARYEGMPARDTAEIAMAVRPGWRRAGLGSVLACLLAEAATARGFTRFTASYLAANRAVAALLDRAGCTRVITDGVAEAVVRLDGGGVGGGQ